MMHDARNPVYRKRLLMHRVGIALSVLATGALVLVAPSWAAALQRRRVPLGIAEMVVVPAAACLATAPLVAGPGSVHGYRRRIAPERLPTRRRASSPTESRAQDDVTNRSSERTRGPSRPAATRDIVATGSPPRRLAEDRRVGAGMRVSV